MHVRCTTLCRVWFQHPDISSYNPCSEYMRYCMIMQVEISCRTLSPEKAHLLNLKGTTNGTWSEDEIESRTCTPAVSTSRYWGWK